MGAAAGALRSPAALPPPTAGEGGRRPSAGPGAAPAAVRRGRGAASRSVPREAARRPERIPGEAGSPSDHVSTPRRCIAPHARRHVARLDGIRGHGDDAGAGIASSSRRPPWRRRSTTSSPASWPSRMTPSTHGQPRCAATSAGGRRWPGEAALAGDDDVRADLPAAATTRAIAARSTAESGVPDPNGRRRAPAQRPRRARSPNRAAHRESRRPGSSGRGPIRGPRGPPGRSRRADPRRGARRRRRRRRPE